MAELDPLTGLESGKGKYTPSPKKESTVVDQQEAKKRYTPSPKRKKQTTHLGGQLTSTPHSKYNFNVGPSDVRSGLDSDIRANNQDFLDEMANSFVQIGSTILGQTAESFGAILDPGAWAAYIGNTDEVYSNALMDFGRNIQEGGRENFPILQHSSPSFHEWWFQGMPSIASALSMMIPTLGITRGLATALVRGARLLNGVNRAKAVNGLASIMMGGAKTAVNPISQAVLSRHAENMMESYQTGAELEEELMLKGYSQEDAKRFAAEGAASNYRTGWWLLGTDILQYGMLGLKTKTPFEKAFGMNAKSGTKISRATNLGTQMISEGLEESFQYYAAENGKYRAKLKAGLIDEKSFFNRFKEGLHDREMWDSFIFGALGGGVFSALGPIAQKYGDKFVSREEHKRQATDTANFMKGHIGVLASQLQDLNAAIESGNPRAVREVKVSMFSERILQAIHKDYGRQDGITTNLNNLVKQLESLENASDEELADFAKQSGIQGGVLNKESLSEIIPQIKAEVEIAKKSFGESIYRGNDATFATMYAHSKIMQNRFGTQAEEGARNYAEAKQNHQGDINDTIVYGQALNLLREGNYFKAMVNMMSQEELNDLEKIAEKYSKMYPYDEETKVPKELVNLAAAELQDRMAAEHSGTQAAKYEDKSYQKEIEKQMNIRGVKEATDEQHLKDLAEVLGIEIVDGKLTKKSKDKDLNKAVEEKMAEFEKAKQKAKDDAKRRAAQGNRNPETVVDEDQQVSSSNIPFGDQSGFSESDTISDVSSSTSGNENSNDNTTTKVAPEALDIAEVEKAKKVKIFKGDSLINTLGFEFITDEEQKQKLLDYLLKGVSSTDKIRIEINPSLIENPKYRAQAEKLLKHIHNVIGNPDLIIPFEDVFALINENYAELREALFEIPVSVVIETEDGDLPPLTINTVRPEYGINGNQINMRASAVAAALTNSTVTTTFYEALPQNSFQIANGEKGQSANWLIDENASNLYVSTKNGFAKNVRTGEPNYNLAVGTLTPGTYYALITDPTGKKIPVALDRWSKDQPMPPKAVDVLMYVYEGIVTGKISYKADVNAYPKLVSLLTGFAEDMGMNYKDLIQIMLPPSGKVDISATLNFFILEGSYFKTEDGGQNRNNPFSIYSSKNKNNEGFTITYAGNQFVIKDAVDFAKHRETFKDFLSNKVMNIDVNRINSNPAYRKFVIDNIFSTDISKDNPWKLPVQETKKELNEELKRRGEARGTDPQNIDKIHGIPGTPNLSPHISITTNGKTILRNTNTITIEHGGKTYEVVEKNGKFVLANGKVPGEAIRIIAAMKTKKVPYAVVTINNRGKEMKIAIVDVGNGVLKYLSIDGSTKGSLFLKNSHIAKAANAAYAKAHPKNTKNEPSDPLVDEAKKIEEELKASNQSTQSAQTKEGVSELFESNPELANEVYEALGFGQEKGTKNEISSENNNQITPQQKQKALQQYSQYLDTIFPDSKVKDVVYHGSPNTEIKSFLSPEKEGYKKQETTTTGVAGIYVTDVKEIADKYQDFENKGIKGKTYSLIVNVKRPLIVGEKATDGISENTFGASSLWNIQKGVITGLRKAGIDGIMTGNYARKNNAMGENTEIAVFEPEQIHILGGKQNIEGFKKFVKGKSDTGAGESTTSKNSKAAEDVRKKLDEVRKAGSNLKITDNELQYVDTETGEKFERVTSVISAKEPTEESKKKNNEIEILNSSKTIGTKIDELVRDFFDGNYIQGKDYGISDQQEFLKFVNQLKSLKKKFDKNGEVVIANDIILFDKELGIAGTVDLITYDRDGNVRIYDMKTMRGNQFTESYGNQNKTKYYTTAYGKSNAQKHQEQLSLYRIMLYNTYGILAKDLEVIPIQVRYPDVATQTSMANLLGTLPVEPLDSVVSNWYNKDLSLKTDESKEAAPKIDNSNPFGNQLGFADMNGGLDANEETKTGENKTDNAVDAFDLMLGGKKAPEKKGSNIPKTGC